MCKYSRTFYITTYILWIISINLDHRERIKSKKYYEFAEHFTGIKTTEQSRERRWTKPPNSYKVETDFKQCFICQQETTEKLGEHAKTWI